MNASLKGGCLCGGVRYELYKSPLVAYYCHCNDCKKSTGSAFHVGMVVHASDITITANNLQSYTKPADSGNDMTRQFCGDCGSPLFTQDSGAPHHLVIKAGSLDEPELITPIAQLWTLRKVSWATIDSHIQSFNQGKAYEIKGVKSQQ